MTATAEQLRSSLLALPDADRAELAQLLFESLPDGESGTEDNAFDELLTRRAEEIRDGRVTGLSAAELFARLDARLAAGQ